MKEKEGMISFSYDEINDAIIVLTAFVRSCPKGMMDERYEHVKSFLGKLRGVLEECGEDEDMMQKSRKDIN